MSSTAGTALLDPSGNFILDASGNRILSDGTYDCPCCWCYIVPCDGSPSPDIGVRQADAGAFGGAFSYGGGCYSGLSSPLPRLPGTVITHDDVMDEADCPTCEGPPPPVPCDPCSDTDPGDGPSGQFVSFTDLVTSFAGPDPCLDFSGCSGDHTYTVAGGAGDCDILDRVDTFNELDDDGCMCYVLRFDIFVDIGGNTYNFLIYYKRCAGLGYIGTYTFWKATSQGGGFSETLCAGMVAAASVEVHM